MILLLSRVDRLQADERTYLLTNLLRQLLESTVHDFADSRIVPNEKGVYLIYDKAKGLIYAGQSGRLRPRLFHDHLAGNINGSHFRKSLQQHLGAKSEDEIKRYISNQCVFQFLTTDTEYKYLEHFAIAVLKPLLNR
jgi:excinuclease UvrABC nuclease subunit